MAPDRILLAAGVHTADGAGTRLSTWGARCLYGSRS